jgi:hypothetical protein
MAVHDISFSMWAEGPRPMEHRDGVNSSIGSCELAVGDLSFERFQIKFKGLMSCLVAWC